MLLLVPAMGMLRDEWSEAAETSVGDALAVLATHRPAAAAPFVGAGFVLSFTWSIGIYGIAYALAGQSRGHPRSS